MKNEIKKVSPPKQSEQELASCRYDTSDLLLILTFWSTSSAENRGIIEKILIKRSIRVYVHRQTWYEGMTTPFKSG